MNSRKYSTTLRVMPQDWEPKDWAEAHASRAAREIARLREPRSAQWLSDRTAELGYRVSRSVIADLENGRRKYLAVHELVVLAKALDVAPLQLLYGQDNALTIEYLPGDEVTRLSAVQNFSGISEEILKRYEETVESLLKAAEAARDAARSASLAFFDAQNEAGNVNRSTKDGG
ncbi:hypothetical protein MMOR_14030 [Mycolicibacterium moriokaense]|uniref:HTH cro/C1-type domain-containing protein n=2 Tax=Mycolicibacterium moriokaense TaxID=39691 RepID=A0AAD1M4P4_9MYCO|nr:hypothetical protein MMOR_14030 [Mycolicibacterium moriokaense]